MSVNHLINMSFICLMIGRKICFARLVSIVTGFLRLKKMKLRSVWHGNGSTNEGFVHSISTMEKVEITPQTLGHVEYRQNALNKTVGSGAQASF